MIKNLSRSIGLLIIVLVCITCQASSKDKNEKNFLKTEKSEGWGKAIPDSVASIIFDAKRVTCTLVGQSKEDTVRVDSVRTLTDKQITVAQYLLLDPVNFKTDKKVYGIFRPWVSFRFEAKRKQEVQILVDLGLSKWQVVTKDNKVVCQKDLENKMEAIRLLRIAFPDDVTLRLLNENLNVIAR